MYHKWWSYDVCFLGCGTWQTEFFVILGHFLLFYTTDNLKNQNFEKMNKMPGDIIILFKSTKNLFLRYGAWQNAWRYCHFTYVYHKWQSYDVCFLRCGTWQTEFFVILGHFLLIYTTNNLKNQNFLKMNKMPGDIIIQVN